MSQKEDVFDSFAKPLASQPLQSPWLEQANGTRSFHPDYELLAQLLGIPVAQGRSQESGRFAKAIDAWVAQELRRAGFEPDEVWPRLSRPRVMSREIALLLDALPEKTRAEVERRLPRRAAPTEANVLGRVYVKQADVLIAQWARGPELLVSTKSMLSSYGKNLRNRFEESYGDAKNIRGRFPLVSFGFLFLLRSTVLAEPASFELAIDMLRKLREEADVYDTTSLIIAEWDDSAFSGVTLRNDLVPLDLQVAQFLETLIARVLERTPVQFHVRVRERREQRELPIIEGELSEE